MSRILVSTMVGILWMGLVFNAESLAGLSDMSLAYLGRGLIYDNSGKNEKAISD